MEKRILYILMQSFHIKNMGIHISCNHLKGHLYKTQNYMSKQK